MLAAGLSTATGAAAKQPTADPPSRVMIVVIDQLRPDYVERFDMANVRALMDGGVNFERAILGHMAAETVITHNVLTSGRLPKHMGWVNEVYRDVDGVLGPAGSYQVTSSLGCGQFDTLLRAQGYPKLDDQLGGQFISVGQKTTAACPAGHPADPEDIVVHIGSRNTQCEGSPPRTWRRPGGFNIPTYINEDCGRYFVNAADTLDYGTATTSPAWMYPLDGNRFAVGDDAAHRGGDVWTADAAIEMMENETDWRGMMVTFGSVDKAAHMWGTDDDGPSGVGDDVHEQAHLPFAARTADLQVGRLLAALEEQGIRDDTLVVLTTDHAGQTAHRYHGQDGALRGNFNWYYGADSDETYKQPQPALAPLVATGNVDFSYQDGHIATWLHDRSPAKLGEAAAAIRSMPDVIASYVRDGDRYRRVGPTGAMSGRERSWWVRWGQELIDTMAAPSGPDVVGLLRDDVSYGVAGDHGGHQRAIQEVPMAFSWPGLKSQARQEHFRAVDVVPTVLRLMGIEPVAGSELDGEAYRLKQRH
jgi:arylsulfatase A-like enzyme